MKARPASALLPVLLLLLLPALLHAQQFDANATRSADMLRSGVQAFHRGYYNEAILSLEKALSYKPSNVLALTWLGRAQLKAGYEEEAARSWQQVVDAGTGSALVREWLGVLSYRRGIGRDLAGGTAWVVSSVLDAGQKGAYPFRRPSSVRPRPDGTFWVVAFGSNELLRFDANFRLLATFKGGLQGFDRPFDVAEAADGTLFVSEYGGNRIARLDPRGEKVGTFGSTGRGDGGLLGPQYLALDSRGTLWVTDWGNNRLVRFATDGSFLQAVPGVEGPTGIAVHEGRLYVAEGRAKRIASYDLSGNRLGVLGEGALQSPEGICFAPDGALLVADGTRVLAGDLERETWTVRGEAAAWAARLVQQGVTPNGAILAADFDENKVLLLTDTTSLAAGLAVRVERVNSVKFPEVWVDLSVSSRAGAPVVGLLPGNFIVTEGHAAVGAPSLAVRNTGAKATDVALLVERSPAMETLRAEVQGAVADLYAQVAAPDRLAAVSAGERAVREAAFGETRLRFQQLALQAPVSSRWRFDLGARLAGDELVSSASGARRAIVFYTTGTLGGGAFGTYSALEIAAYLRNNDISLSAVLFGGAPVDEDLAWIAAATGGKVYRASSPEGIPAVAKDLRARTTSTYTLRYTSQSPAEFGERYIPVEVEVTSQKVSGRDESGYYAPAGYEPPSSKSSGSTSSGSSSSGGH